MNAAAKDLVDPAMMADLMQHLLAMTLPFLIILVAGQALVSFIKRGERVYRPAPRNTTAGVADEPVPAAANKVWTEAVQICEVLAEQVADYEFDLDQRYFQRPLLADPTELLTMAWLEAKEDMDAALSQQPPKDAAGAEAALVAAQRARGAWEKAWRHAGIVGLGTMEVEDRRRMRQAEKILARAADQATTEAERATCIDRIVAILSEVVAVDRFTIRRSIATHISSQLSIAGPAPQAAITAAPENGNRRAV